MLETIHAMGATRNGITARVCTTAGRRRSRPIADGALAIIPAVENGHAIGEDLGLLARFRDLGVAYITHHP